MSDNIVSGSQASGSAPAVADDADLSGSRALEAFWSLPRNGKVLAILVTVTTTIVLGLFVGGTLYFCWSVAWKAVVDWPGKNLFLWLPAGFALLVVGFGPIWAAMFAVPVWRRVVASVLVAARGQVADALQRVQDAEAQLLASVEKTDGAGLMPLVRYSRIQLDAYYLIGLTQARRSFKHAVVAMWIGFVVLIGGLLLQVMPVENLGLAHPTSGLNALVVGVGTVIEFVSALFLWVYRATTSQLTYFYDRQMYVHSIVMCTRIADSITPPDETRRAIVDKMLERVTAPEFPISVPVRARS
jgi:hypothetical protein